jgi:hypothetical protein
LDRNWLDAEPELLADYDKAVDTARAAGARRRVSARFRGSAAVLPGASGVVVVTT